MGGGVHVAGLGSFLPLHSFCTLSASVLYTCIFMYILHVQCRGRYRGAGGGTPSFHSAGLTPPLSRANCRLHTSTHVHCEYFHNARTFHYTHVKSTYMYM